MTRTSVAAVVLACLAFAIGVAGPALDPAVLEAQLGFAGRVTERSEPATPVAEERGLREEAGRWIARKLRERNDRANAEARANASAVAGETGLFGGYAAYVTPAQILLALPALGLALVDWLRTRNARVGLTAALVAGAAIILPFAWSAIAIAVTVAAVLIALVFVGALLGG